MMESSRPRSRPRGGSGGGNRSRNKRWYLLQVRPVRDMCVGVVRFCRRQLRRRELRYDVLRGSCCPGVAGPGADAGLRQARACGARGWRGIECVLGPYRLAPLSRLVELRPDQGTGKGLPQLASN